MSEESKPVDVPDEEAAGTPTTKAAGKEPAVESGNDSGSESDDPAVGTAGTAGAAGTAGTAEAADQASTSTKKKKKKSKRKKIKEALTGTGDSEQDQKKKALEGLTPQQIQDFLELNPALKNEIDAQLTAGGSSSNPDSGAMLDALKRLRLQDIMTGLASSGKNRKDMASYKFWSTQPVPQFTEEQQPALIKEGPIKIQSVDDIPADPPSLALDGFRWVTVDLNNELEMQEVYKLLNGHYVEDNEAMFRFNYSPSML